MARRPHESPRPTYSVLPAVVDDAPFTGNCIVRSHLPLHRVVMKSYRFTLRPQPVRFVVRISHRRRCIRRPVRACVFVSSVTVVGERKKNGRQWPCHVFRDTGGRDRARYRNALSNGHYAKHRFDGVFRHCSRRETVRSDVPVWLIYLLVLAKRKKAPCCRRLEYTRSAVTCEITGRKI